LKYLASGADFDGHTWLNTIPSNNDYPHAPWWTYDPEQEPSYNPTASLIGFIVKFAEKNSELNDKGSNLAIEAYAQFKQRHPLEEMHTAACFVALYQALKDSGSGDLLDLAEFKELLMTQIQHVITYDTTRWSVDYVCKPSLFINSIGSDFYLPNLYICYYECEFIANTQASDGTWPVTWAWADYPEQWEISKNWWQSDLIIKNMRFLAAISS